MKFIKNFKLGKWSALFVIAIPLFVIGYMSNGNPIDDSIFRAFTSTFKLLTLSFDFNFALTSTNIAFKVTLYACYVAVLINDLLIAGSLLSQTLYNWGHVIALKRSRKDTCIVIGNNDQSIMIFRNSPVKCIIADVMNNEQKEGLFLKKVHYHGSTNEDTLVEYIKKTFKKHGRKVRFLLKVKNSSKFVQWLCRFKKDDILPRCRVIINTNNDETNIRLADKISAYINKTYWELACIKADKVDEYNTKAVDQLSPKDFEEVEKIREIFLTDESEAKRKKLYEGKERNALILNYIDIYSFGDINYEDNYEKYKGISKGCLHYVNSQVLIAKDFVTKYPLALHLTDKHVDYNTALIKEGVKINVAFIGFGKKNKELFLSMLATNQLMCKDGKGDIKQYGVNYHFYDKSNAFTSKSLTNYGFRYKHEFVDSKKIYEPDYEKNYLVAPYFPFLEDFDKRTHPIDINYHKFYDHLKEQLCSGDKEKTINYIIVSLGNDEETTDASSKIIAKLIQWDIASNSHVFAGIDSESINNNKGLFDFGSFKNFNTYGCEPSVVYNYSKIVNDFYTKLSVKQKAIYDTLWNVKYVDPTQFSCLTEKHYNSWNDTLLYDRMSSLYATLSINHKLMLMGKKLVKAKEGENLHITTLAEFNKYFEGYFKAYWGAKYIAMQKTLAAYMKNPTKVDEDKMFTINGSYPVSTLKDVFNTDEKTIEKIQSDYIWFYRDETNFSDDSIRTNLAKLEHERWNCYMMFKGFVPLSKEGIKRYGKQKNMDTREHACLTTFKGLEQLAKVLVQDGLRKTEMDGDYKHYDYQIMDALPLLLLNTGYVIEDK